MTILETLQSIPALQVIYVDDAKILCSARVTIMRNETINSGSMQFTHPRYHTFGQFVIFTSAAIAEDQAGALVFNPETPEEAKEIIENLAEYITREKEPPDDSILIGD